MHIVSTVSTGTLPHTCIFPLSSAAFMILPVTEALTAWPPQEHTSIRPQVDQRVTKFSQLHHKCYVILTASMFAKDEKKALSIVQQKYIVKHSLGFLLAHNSTECADCMSSIVKVTSKGTSAVIRERMKQVHKKLLSQGTTLRVIKGCGVSRHAATVLLDGCGSLAGLARDSTDTVKLTDCSLDSDTAHQVKEFFS